MINGQAVADQLASALRGRPEENSELIQALLTVASSLAAQTGQGQGQQLHQQLQQHQQQQQQQQHQQQQQQQHHHHSQRSGPSQNGGGAPFQVRPLSGGGGPGSSQYPPLRARPPANGAGDFGGGFGSGGSGG
eukprot:CAMPEP_0204187066 /NCGR_PEP_ID=MMETSP0361-20130328/56500_1 /ASSEMBLY_ACC=CAM_ASM_000343 /TAXON_ID=268821 /ORGANISM="Scrippsiella Hangoei, Strain SHTV-5" /LENGTH=132 /DNA_ID=CAMNT_0051147427 /DNA_START=41 /DNA_END=435 /DNA_ORIENTATION=+